MAAFSTHQRSGSRVASVGLARYHVSSSAKAAFLGADSVGRLSNMLFNASCWFDNILETKTT